MPSQTFPHEADIGVRGAGAPPEEAFAGAALTLTAVICDPATVALRAALDVARHRPAAEAKGVSFCELKVCQQADGQWLAQAVVDV